MAFDEIVPLKEVMKSQKVARYRLLKIFYEDPISMKQLSDKIGINVSTLNHFLLDEKDMELIPLVKTIKWIESEERRKMKKSQ